MKTILFSLFSLLLLVACGNDEKVSDTAGLPLAGCVSGKICKGDIYTQDLLQIPFEVSIPVMRLYLVNKKNLSAKSPLKNTVAKTGGLNDVMHGLGFVMGVLKVNPIFALSLSALESGWGSSRIAREKYNLWGWQAYDGSSTRSAQKFSSFTHGFSHVFSRIKHFYLREGGRYYKQCTPPKRFQKYVRRAGCSDKHCGASLAGMNCKY
ncbi:MAG: glucosaminidase domain-containing protein, partial [Pseudomonadota bacterium]|nr:glucosaminidase domain-containing protein [Pseudomonadota bacterium]